MQNLTALHQHTGQLTQSVSPLSTFSMTGYMYDVFGKMCNKGGTFFSGRQQRWFPQRAGTPKYIFHAKKEEEANIEMMIMKMRAFSLLHPAVSTCTLHTQFSDTY